MDQLEYITLTVESVEIKDDRYKVKAGGNSYSFFKFKKDGNNTRAFQDFERLQVKAGKTYTFGVKESQGEYNGQPITYRNIAIIDTQKDYPQPGSSQTSAITREEFDNLKDRVDALAANVLSGSPEPEVPSDVNVNDILF